MKKIIVYKYTKGVKKELIRGKDFTLKGGTLCFKKPFEEKEYFRLAFPLTSDKTL